MELPPGNLVIRFEEVADRKVQICDEILRALPQWFGIEAAIGEYNHNVKNSLFVTATLNNRVIGFCAIVVHHGINADLYVLGIFEEFHGRGIGTKMIEFITAYCRQQGIPYMTVKTLSERHPDEYYNKTRQFYEKCGFQPFEEFPTLWGEANPCLYMLKAVK
jgi:ribosomal protein S18 acetylase RimI-like enzyme